MIAKGINAPRTSSIGRLFDAVAALVGLRQAVSFEGQAAMELEGIADPNEPGLYPFEWGEGDVAEVRFAPIVEGVVKDTLAAMPAPVVGGPFSQTRW